MAVPDQSHAVAELLLNAQEEERARIGRELHDGIGQELALLIYQMERAAQLPATKEEITDQISQLTKQAKKIGMHVRGISHNLHPAELDYLGLPTAIESFCREFSQTCNIEIDCICGNTVRKLSRAVALALYRVLQEALHNIKKHSNSRDARVELVGDNGQVVLRVCDSGDGFKIDDPSRPGGLGLMSMRERVYAIGGKIRIQSEPGVGTRVEVSVPMPLSA